VDKSARLYKSALLRQSAFAKASADKVCQPTWAPVDKSARLYKSALLRQSAEALAKADSLPASRQDSP
jgi:hypothetical protein